MRGVLAFRSSPEQRLEALYRNHAAEVYRHALAMLGSPGDAEDVTQATFVNAYRAIRRGELPREPGAWLRTIAHNLCREHFRQATRRPRPVGLDEGDVGELVAADDEQTPSLDDLIRALKHLPYSQRAALVMRELEGRPLKEIAKELEVTPSAVETLLFRARRGLREQLETSLSCVEAEQAISRQLDGLLTRPERGALRAHLRQCDQCAQLARRLRAQRGALRSLALVPLPSSIASVPIGGAVAGGAAGGAAVGASLVSKVAVGALAAALAAGASYEGATGHVWRLVQAGPHRDAHSPGLARRPPEARALTPSPAAPQSSPAAARTHPLTLRRPFGAAVGRVVPSVAPTHGAAGQSGPVGKAKPTHKTSKHSGQLQGAGSPLKHHRHAPATAHVRHRHSSAPASRTSPRLRAPKSSHSQRQTTAVKLGAANAKRVARR